MYRSNPAVAKFQSWENYKYEDAKAFVNAQISQTPNQPGTWFQFAITLANSNELIGDCALHTLLNEPRIVEMGLPLPKSIKDTVMQMRQLERSLSTFSLH